MQRWTKTKEPKERKQLIELILEKIIDNTEDN